MVFLEGLIGPSASEFDGYWYRASPEGDAAMRKILTEPAALLRENKPAVVPAITASAILVAVLGLLVPRLLRHARQGQFTQRS